MRCKFEITFNTVNFSKFDEDTCTPTSFDKINYKDEEINLLYVKPKVYNKLNKNKNYTNNEKVSDKSKENSGNDDKSNKDKNKKSLSSLSTQNKTLSKNNKTTASLTLKNSPDIILDPKDLNDFQNKILLTKKAQKIFYHKDGTVISKDWVANKLTESSDIINNILTDSYYKKNREIIETVKVKVI